jgi:hypothetical protein
LPDNLTVPESPAETEIKANQMESPYDYRNYQLAYALNDTVAFRCPEILVSGPAPGYCHPDIPDYLIQPAHERRASA